MKTIQKKINLSLSIKTKTTQRNRNYVLVNRYELLQHRMLPLSTLGIDKW